MTRFVGICQYDGTLFSGFQFQKNARSVQDELEKALKSFSNLSSRVNCAGRTDKGVHALSQIFDFSVENPSRNINWIAAFNSSLPDDLAVTHVEEADSNFHARFSAYERSYVYLIKVGEIRSTFLRNYVYHVSKPIDLKLLSKELKGIIGTHDFSAFRSSQCSAKDPVKTISKASFEERDNLICIEFSANAFLHNMIRILIGTLVENSTNADSEYTITDIISSKDRALAGKTAPANGLYFLGAKYKDIQNTNIPFKKFFDSL